MNTSPGRAAPTWRREGDGSVVIDIPPDTGEVLYAVGLDRTLDADDVLTEVGADQPMPLEVFIETVQADWRSRRSVVLNLDGSGVQKFIVALFQFKQTYYTSEDLLGVHISESVRATLPGLQAGDKAYAAGIIVNGFPVVSTPDQAITQGKVTLRQLGKNHPQGRVFTPVAYLADWIETTRSTNAFDLPGTFKWEARSNAGVAVVCTWSRNVDGNVVGVVPQGQGEVQYGRSIDEALRGDALYLEVGSSVAQTQNVYLEPVQGDYGARRFAQIALSGAGLQQFTVPLSQFGLAPGARVYQIGIQDTQPAAHVLTIGRIAQRIAAVPSADQRSALLPDLRATDRGSAALR